MPMPSEDEMRTEFHSLCDQRDEIMQKVAPYRAAYDAKRAELDAREKAELLPLRQRMELEQAQLFDINRQIGMLSRALGGRTGDQSPRSTESHFMAHLVDEKAASETQTIGAADVGKLPADAATRR